MTITVRRLTDEDDLAGWLTLHWGSDGVVSHGRVFRADELEGLVAERNGLRGGVLTWVEEGDTTELVSLDASTRREGIGSNLVTAAIEQARERGNRRLILTTTNDNCTALIFWQRLGFRMTALRPGGALESRKLLPGSPEVGENGIPVRDEIDLELRLD